MRESITAQEERDSSLEVRSSIKQILIRRDGMTESDAKDLIAEARDELNSMLIAGEDPSDICEIYFGLEPDYLDELIPI